MSQINNDSDPGQIFIENFPAKNRFIFQPKTDFDPGKYYLPGLGKPNTGQFFFDPGHDSNSGHNTYIASAFQDNHL